MTLPNAARALAAQLATKRDDHSASQDGVLLYDRAAKHPVVSVDGAFRRLAVLVGVPATATSPGEPGDYAVDGSHLYLCRAPAVWVRVAVSTF